MKAKKEMSTLEFIFKFFSVVAIALYYHILTGKVNIWFGLLSLILFMAVIYFSVDLEVNAMIRRGEIKRTK